MQDEKRNPSDFQVVDRRKFTDEGDLRGDVRCDPGVPEAIDDDGSGSREIGDGAITADFAFILNNLAMPAVAFLGDIPDPTTGQTQQNLPVAKLFIDSLIVLREKTRGNLTEDEQHLLDGLLTNLQLRYVEISGSHPTVP